MDITVERIRPSVFNQWTDGKKIVIDTTANGAISNILRSPNVDGSIIFYSVSVVELSDTVAHYTDAVSTIYIACSIAEFLYVRENNPSRNLILLVS